MNRSLCTRLLAGTTLAALAAAPAAAAPLGVFRTTPEQRNQAPVTHLDYGFAQGWRTERHLREAVDLDGDRHADLVGFGDQGVHVSFGTVDATFTGSSLAVRNFGWNQGWRTDRHPRELVDVDGDGALDVVGIGDGGVWVSHGTADGTLTDPVLVLRDFGVAQGWRVGHHPRLLVDVDADGRADLVGFGDAGVHVARGQADRTFSAPVLALRDLGRNQGWRTDRHLRELADVDGDGLLDVVGLGDAGVHVARGRADGTFTAPALALRNFGAAQGWRIEHHPRHLADVGADGRADLVGFGDAGVWVSHGTADGTFSTPAMALRDLGRNQGWRTDRHQRQLADLNGDGRAEIVAFGYNGILTSYTGFDGNFAFATLELADYGWNQGWRPDRHVRRLADVTGDGLPEAVGFGDLGTLVTDWLAGDV